jgi:hypothetical protein
MRCLGAAKIRDPNHTNEQSLRHCSMFEYLPKALTILAPASELEGLLGKDIWRFVGHLRSTLLTFDREVSLLRHGDTLR